MAKLYFMKVLPIASEQEVDEGPSCVAISGGLSVEQVWVANEMLRVKHQVRQVARELEAVSGEARGELERQMAALRQRWQELVAQREEARRRKMRALGFEG